MRSRKLFVGVMACITAIAVTVMVDNNSDYAESATEEISNLVVDEPSLITTESFDVLKYEIEAKVTETEEDTEMTEELTTEMTTEPVTEEITEKVEEKSKKTQTQKKPTKKTQTKETQTKNNKPPKNADEAIKSATEIASEDLSANVVTEMTELSEGATTQAPVTEEVTEAPIVEEPATEALEQKMYHNMSEDDIYTFAALIYLEAGATSYKCQCAVGSVVLNLMMKEGKNLHQCIKTPGRFSVASRVYRTKPSSTSLEAARQIVTSGPTLPTYVTCFRNNHYFSWAKSYCCIDNVYFSYY